MICFNVKTKNLESSAPDKKMLGFLEKWLHIIVPIAILTASFALRWFYAPIVDNNDKLTDYNRYLQPWVNFYRDRGIIAGLRMGIGNYFVPYNVFLACISKLPVEPYYPIMLLSTFFDYAMVVVIFKIIRHLALIGEKVVLIPGRYVLTAAASIAALPVVIVNSSLWKQCDSIWTAFLLMALYCFCKDRYRGMFICTGMAFAMKLQAVFMVPFLVMAYLAKGKIPLRGFLWIPAGFLIGGLPAILCGRPILDTYSIYFGQVELHKVMCENSPGIYSIGMADYALFHKMAFVLTLVVFSLALLYVIEHRDKMGPAKWIYLCGWCMMTCFEFLPAMHERYDYPALVILTVCILFFHRIVIPVIIMHLVSACTYAHCLWRYSPNYMALAIFYLIAWVWITYDLMCGIAGRENGFPPQKNSNINRT